jgi:3'5'-cyclic nucleotide phosphodiesterase
LYTYGITSDPLTQFSCVFSALIHDVDHSGVPNATLVKERTELACRYQNKSVAEQNSVDLAWNLLMEDQYIILRQAIYTTDTELRRFRQLIVNSVMATDIVDAQQKDFRNARWDRAFSSREDDDQSATHRKATIVIEHLIQASDVAHTMRHCHIYRKWNERFFKECYQAYISRRSDIDPSINWYQGEIGFFDFYIIPLAKKLKNCGVFGVSSDEYLNYAIQNRQEWESRGQEVVRRMLEQEGMIEGQTHIVNEKGGMIEGQPHVVTKEEGVIEGHSPTVKTKMETKTANQSENATDRQATRLLFRVTCTTYPSSVHKSFL